MLSVLIPFWLVRTMTGWRETLAVWIPLLVIGGTFAAVQFFWSNFVGFELVDIVASVSSMAAGVLILRALEAQEDLAVRPRGRGRPDAIDQSPGATADDPPATDDPLSSRRVARAWMPFALLTVTVLIWGIPAIKSLGDSRGQGLARRATLVEAGDRAGCT